LVLGYENIVEVGYIRTYAKKRVDNPDKSFTMTFFDAGFNIKNIPIPMHYRGETPPIVVKIKSGDGGDVNSPIIYEFTQTFWPTPGAFSDLGIDVGYEVYNGVNTPYMDTYFVP